MTATAAAAVGSLPPLPSSLLLPQGLSKSAISSSVLGRRHYGLFFTEAFFASLNSVNCFNTFFSGLVSLTLCMKRRERKGRHVFGMRYRGRNISDLMIQSWRSLSTLIKIRFTTTDVRAIKATI